MKNIIVLGLFVAAIILSPLVSSASLVDIENSLNSISGAIDRNTEAISQSRIDALDQSCVSLVKQEINVRDTYLKDIDQKIADTRDKMNQAYDVADRINSSNYLGYLYTLQKRQTQLYSNIVFESCSGQYAQKTIEYLVSRGCQKKYGANSTWLGDRNNDGTWHCGCSLGYQFNTNDQCVMAEKVEQDIPTKEVVAQQPVSALKVPTLTNDQMCQNRLDHNAVWTGEKDKRGGLICDCKSGYQQSPNLTCEPVREVDKKVEVTKTSFVVPQPKVVSISTTTERVKIEKKSFWSKVRLFFRL